MSSTTAAPASPTYHCSSYSVPLVDTDASYCIVPGGHPRMSACCGSNPVNFRPSCFSWCNIPLSDNITTSISASTGDGWSAMANVFLGCLQEDGGAQPQYVVCQPDVSQVAQNADAPITYAPFGIPTATSSALAVKATPLIVGAERTLQRAAVLVFVITQVVLTAAA